MNAVAEKKIKNYDLIVQAKEGSEEAMESLIKLYDKFIWQSVNKVTKEPDRSKDLYQIGVIALIEAVSLFDVDKGYEFMSFLYMQVRGKILRDMRDNKMIKIPTKTVDISVKIKKQGLLDDTIRDISYKLGEKEEDVAEALIFIENEYPLSTQGTVDSGRSNNVDTGVLGDLIVKDLNGENWEDKIELKQYISKLPERERYVITERYYNDKKQEEIGQVLKLKQQSVARYERSALENLRRLMRGESIVLPTDGRGKGTVSTKGNQGLAKALTRKGELSNVQISRLTGVSTGTIGFWKSKLRKGKEI